MHMVGDPALCDMLSTRLRHHKPPHTATNDMRTRSPTTRACTCTVHAFTTGDSRQGCTSLARTETGMQNTPHPPQAPVGSQTHATACARLPGCPPCLQGRRAHVAPGCRVACCMPLRTASCNTGWSSSKQQTTINSARSVRPPCKVPQQQPTVTAAAGGWCEADRTCATRSVSLAPCTHTHSVRVCACVAAWACAHVLRRLSPVQLAQQARASVASGLSRRRACAHHAAEQPVDRTTPATLG
jgi:hypothetical protein